MRLQWRKHQQGLALGSMVYVELSTDVPNILVLHLKLIEVISLTDFCAWMTLVVPHGYCLNDEIS